MNILCNIHDFVIFLTDGLTWGCDHGDVTMGTGLLTHLPWEVDSGDRCWEYVT